MVPGIEDVRYGSNRRWDRRPGSVRWAINRRPGSPKCAPAPRMWFRCRWWTSRRRSWRLVASGASNRGRVDWSKRLTAHRVDWSPVVAMMPPPPERSRQPPAGSMLQPTPTLTKTHPPPLSSLGSNSFSKETYTFKKKRKRKRTKLMKLISPCW